MQQQKAAASAGAVTAATPTENRMGSAGEDRVVESGELATNLLPGASDHGDRVGADRDVTHCRDIICVCVCVCVCVYIHIYICVSLCVRVCVCEYV